MTRDIESRLAKLEAQAAPLRFVVGADRGECERRLVEAGGNEFAVLRPKLQCCSDEFLASQAAAIGQAQHELGALRRQVRLVVSWLRSNRHGLESRARSVVIRTNRGCCSEGSGPVER